MRAVMGALLIGGLFALYLLAPRDAHRHDATHTPGAGSSLFGADGG